jgi:glycine cleavage system aminomethyltransferase T
MLQAPLALAYVRRELSSPGSRLESSIGDAEVVALPLV